jgi:signal transduction histidine kinase
MSFVRLKQATQTLRFRLMVWNAGVVLLTSLGILIGVREGLRYSLLSEMDQILKQDINEIGLAVREQRLADLSRLQQDLNRKARAHQQDGWFVQLLGPRGLELFASENTPEPRPLAESFEIPRPVSALDHRMRQESLRTYDDQRVTVRVGARLDFLSRDMQRIDSVALLVVVIMLVVAPVGGYWLAGRATRPLAGIIHTMARLRPDQLLERLPLRKTGDELDQLSVTFNKLLDKIADYLQQHRDSMANAAHELRTPLAAIRSSIEVCLNEERSSTDYKDLLANVIEQSAALETLVNQLLLLAETEADRLKIVGNYVDLHTVVERCVDMFRGVADFKGIELVLAPPPPTFVEGNRHHLRQLMNNLLDNALKFTPGGGRVVVALTRQPDEHRCTLTVADNGPGISAEELPLIFERFYRGDKARQRDHATRGTGLGLCICKAVVEAHSGQILVESTLGVGTTFSIRLPLLSPEALAVAREQAHLDPTPAPV